jgi:hypothetical protein
LEDWAARHGGQYPEKFFWQIDGGSENANKTIIGFCELLIANGIIKTIVLSRLPVGHTHEDIDQAFGVLSKYCQGKPIWSPQDYKTVSEEAFSKNKLKAKMIDIHMVHDFTDWIKPHMDPHFGCCFKNEKTALQFIFEAVPISEKFPLGK